MRYKFEILTGCLQSFLSVTNFFLNFVKIKHFKIYFTNSIISFQICFSRTLVNIYKLPKFFKIQKYYIAKNL